MGDKELLKDVFKRMDLAMDDSGDEHHDDDALWDIWLDLKKWNERENNTED